MIEPKFDASRLRGGSTGLIKGIAKNIKDVNKAREKQFKKQQKAAEDLKNKRSASAKKGAATRAKNRQAAKDAANAPAPKTFNPLKKSSVTGQNGGAPGKPAKITTATPKPSKAANVPATPGRTKRTPPAKSTQSIPKVAPVTKPVRRGRLR